jgi:hypothetical protein
MATAQGFSYEERSGQTVVILHRGRIAATLRGERARKFLDEVEAGDSQLVMARWTGDYRRGNERMARSHPRNGGR